MIRLALPDIREEDIAGAVSVLRSGRLVQGDNVLAFERALEDFSGVPAVVVSSGTAALHLALLALGIGEGDEVLVPAFTFPATANAVERCGAMVRICDVEPGTYVLSPDAVRTSIGRFRGLKALIVVHEFGFPARIREISSIAREHGLMVIEDAACALGTVADGHHPGHYSDAACFSFHPRKAITTGEGGAVMSNDAGLIERVRSLRSHGMQGSGSSLDFTSAGLNYRMTDFQAAIGLGQLGRFGSEIGRRRTVAAGYMAMLSGTSGLGLPADDKGHSWQSFMVVLQEGTDRDKVIESMRNLGVEVTLGAQAINSIGYYMNKYSFGHGDAPVADMLYRRGLVIPIYGSLSKQEAESVAMALKRSV